MGQLPVVDGLSVVGDRRATYAGRSAKSESAPIDTSDRRSIRERRSKKRHDPLPAEEGPSGPRNPEKPFFDDNLIARS